MIVFRLCKARYADDLSGAGAEKLGGRWNGKGQAALYTSYSRALCVAELAVHLPLGIMPDDFVMISIEIPDNAPICEPLDDELPQDWKSIPHANAGQELGNTLLKSNQYLGIKMPSVVVPGEYNLILNPQHPSFTAVKIKKKEDFIFDKRLLKIP